MQMKRDTANKLLLLTRIISWTKLLIRRRTKTGNSKQIVVFLCYPGLHIYRGVYNV